MIWLGHTVCMLGGSLPPQHGTSSGCEWRNGLQLWKVAANILNKQPRTDNKGWSSSLGVGCGANNTSLFKIKFHTKNQTETRTWRDSLYKRPKRLNMDMRFGLQNVRSLYSAGSLTTVSRELVRYMLHLVGVQEVRWEGCGTELVGEYKFFYWRENENHKLGTVFFVHKRIVSAVKRIELLVSYHCSEHSCSNRR
jgi:hypothetical protein